MGRRAVDSTNHSLLSLNKASFLLFPDAQWLQEDGGGAEGTGGGKRPKKEVPGHSYGRGKSWEVYDSVPVSVW